MPTLIFRGGDGSEQRIELGSELTVGREAGNDVVLSDQGVSRRHCRFFLDDEGAVWVEDSGSANGVMVEGSRIAEPAEVAEGVEVAIGSFRVRLAPRRPSGSMRRSGSRPAVRAPAPQLPPARPVRSTRMITAAEAPPRRARPVARPPPRAVSRAASERPMLKGLAGPFAGQTFELDKPKLLVGRVPPADVMIDDDSVSRRHAEIVKIGSRFSVRDLGSANGTFLNGDRVSEAPLEGGDVLRFGVVELSFSGPAGAARIDPAKKKKLIIIGGAAAVLLMLVVGVALSGGGGGGGKRPLVAEAVETPPEQDVNKLMGKCRAYSDTESEMLNWAEAAKYCQMVVDLDPTITDAKRMARQAKKEMEYEGLIKEARQRLSTSQEKEALEILIKIDKDSATMSQARRVFKEAAGLLLKRSKSACKGSVTAGNFELAIPACRRALELTCNNMEGADRETVAYYSHACRQAGVKADYKCPPEYAPFQGTGEAGGQLSDPVAEAEKAIRAMYSHDARVASLMVEYIKEGRPKKTATLLKNYRSRHPAKAKDLNDLILDLDVIDGRWATAQGLLLRANPEDADEICKEAFEAEARILPPKVHSVLTVEMHTQLGKEFFKLAEKLLPREQYDKAFANVYKCWKHDPKNTQCAGAIAQMERAADARLSEEPSCDSVAWAKTITRPESPVYKRAVEVGKKANCGD